MAAAAAVLAAPGTREPATAGLPGTGAVPGSALSSGWGAAAPGSPAHATTTAPSFAPLEFLEGE